MKLINVKSEKGLVNLFADYIVTKLGETNKSIIQVTNCGSFFVINGKTESSSVLNMDLIYKEFKNEYPDIIDKEKINTIDLIKYETKPKVSDEKWFTFFNTERSIYHPKTISLKSLLEKNVITHVCPISCDFSERNLPFFDDIFSTSSFVFTSEFPYGFSKNVDRNKLYYCEYICNHLFNEIYCNQIDIKFSNKINDDEDLNVEIFVSGGLYDKKDVLSLILDVFDFNLENFNIKISDYNIMEDLMKPFDKKPWLVRDRVKDVILF